MKYLVRPIDEKYVSDSIFETRNIIEALKKVDEQYNRNEIKCIIVGCPEDLKNDPKEVFEPKNVY